MQQLKKRPQLLKEKFSINSTDTYLCCLQPLKSKNTKKDFYFIFHEVERMKNN